MAKQDDFADIPPLVPTRDQVDSHLSNRKSQQQEIVNPGYRAPTVKVSTWPVRILLTLIVLTLGAAGYGGYILYGEYESDQRQAELRISDLERRLSMAGESTEESVLNMIERMDFNFSEIDKLWAARRVINNNIDDVRSELAKLGIANEGQDEATANNSQLIAATEAKLLANETTVNSLSTSMGDITQSLAELDAGMAELMGLQSDIESIRVAMNSGDSNLLGLAGRLEFVEQSMESVNAHRLQINETLFRLQENLESLQAAVSRNGGL